MDKEYHSLLLKMSSKAILLFMLLGFSGCTKKLTITWTPAQPTEFVAKPRIKVYMENSGSMDGYMCPGSELKDAVYDYVSNLNMYADTTELNYINNKIIPYRDNLKSFVKDLTPAAFRIAGGDRSHSDIGNMFEHILKRTDSETLSIFISDCILDVPNGDASAFFVNRGLDIRNAFNEQFRLNKDLSVEILRMESTFTGNYYYNSGSERLNNVKRPYYIWIIGNKKLLAQLNKNVPYSEIQHGVKDYFALSTLEEVPFELTNKSGRSNGNTCVCSAESDGKYRLLVKTNLQSTLQDNSMLCSVGNYAPLNPFVEIERIDEIQDKSSDYTHLITVAIDAQRVKSAAEMITLKALDKPYWLDSANDDSGKNVQNNLDKTTGIKYIIQGVIDAYKNDKELVKIKFVINNK